MKTLYMAPTVTDRDLMSPRHRALFDLIQSARNFAPSDELLSLDELATRLKISKTTAYGLTRQRAKVRNASPLPSMKIGKELRFNWSAVVKWLDRLEKGGAA